MHVIIGQILNPLERDELVSVLHINSVPQRQVQLQLQRTTHHGSLLRKTALGRLTSGPFLPSMPSKKRSYRPRTFYRYTAFLYRTRPFSWKRPMRRTVTLPFREVPKPHTQA